MVRVTKSLDTVVDQPSRHVTSQLVNALVMTRQYLIVAEIEKSTLLEQDAKGPDLRAATLLWLSPVRAVEP